MWTAEQHAVDDKTQRLTLSEAGSPVSFARWLELLTESSPFRAQFNQALSSAPFAALFWELPALTRDATAREFECVLIDAPTLARMGPEPLAFSSYFRDAELAVSFDNLGGDAHLVVPTPHGPREHYTHLATFARRASTEQIDAFWSLVGQRVHARLSHTPVWVSTSGLGVGWLHVRLDQRPKYYNHRAYVLGG